MRGTGGNVRQDRWEQEKKKGTERENLGPGPQKGSWSGKAQVVEGKERKTGAHVRSCRRR